jgi:hypothetical protein
MAEQEITVPERVWVIGRPQDFKGRHEGVVRFKTVLPEVAPSVEYICLEQFKKQVIEIVEKWIPMGLYNAPQSYQQEAKQKIIQEIQNLG